MISSAILPTPLARLPWRLIFLIAAIAGFGLVVFTRPRGHLALEDKQASLFRFPRRRNSHFDDQGNDHDASFPITADV